MKAIIFILGLVMGSFLNVCIYRIPKGESISYPPSHCSACNVRIKWYDLFPVVSYLILKGRCRRCHEKISIRYPVIELLNAAVYLLLYINYGYSLLFLKYAILASLMIVIGFIDLDTMDVYLKTVIFGVISGIIFVIIGYFTGDAVLSYILGAVTGYTAIALIILLTRGMGWGDAEICIVSGLYLGLRLVPVMLFIAVILGGLIGILLVITKIRSRKDMIPFGPFISVATLITAIYGHRLLDLYLGVP
ncbi:type 4 prepilin-like proteins leader peptide-processing enzyme [Oxobacter pfennigii]|uniref:Type 4 prepilin-like proteins leader peptide-processing enzyme n=1 Tax=Oxobacter pfennigii TaxID=36849 RepID=A0A0N8NTR3_9CLOT|nr:A24 family peptidase [Oxobacter pfennigii]KPU45552.1 type 4 prepilin-like proteins leader peptide-processing enzyme [Oxobacter pfennigii]